MSQTVEIAPGCAITRLIRGGWQLAGGHGPIDRDEAVADLVAAFDAGVMTFDCADIYAGVEELYGAARARLSALRGEEAERTMRVHTKLVPDLASLRTLKRADVEAIVDRSLRRLRVDRLDLVQFHWWDFDAPGFLDALSWLDDLRRAGKVSLVGGTNFDTGHVREILAAKIPFASMQVQYSVLDRRPAGGLAELCRAHGVALLCYGTAAGGFLSDRWLGAPEPEAPQNRSLVKYKLIMDDFGGWTLFQELLRALRNVADRHGADIASVATRFALDFPGVAAAIVGATSQKHLAANVAAVGLLLTAADRAEVEAVTAEARGPSGEVYALERDRHGRHGAIMKYDLNAEGA
ncbi:MAG TPA: aldo/keto reductase [Roseiarcus sp.]|nr:aldo/keto reductase [Roseiarcus sp.]